MNPLPKSMSVGELKQKYEEYKAKQKWCAREYVGVRASCPNKCKEKKLCSWYLACAFQLMKIVKGK